MITREGLKRITTWITKLALLTAGGQEPASVSQIGLYATLLAEEFPAAIFTDECLEAIAAGGEFFPKYAVLKTALADRVATSKARTAGATSETVPQWMLERILDHSNGHPGPMLTVWLAGKGVDIAEYQRTRPTMLEAKADWSDAEKVRASARKIFEGPEDSNTATLGRMLAHLVKQHASHNLGHVPPEWHP